VAEFYLRLRTADKPVTFALTATRGNSCRLEGRSPYAYLTRDDVLD